MSQSNNYTWGISPSTYTIPKPYGEIFSWRLYQRNQPSPLENSFAYEYFSFALTNSKVKLPVDVICKSRFKDQQKYRLIYSEHSDVFILELIDGVSIPFIRGDWLRLDNVIAYTLDIGHNLPLVQVNSINTSGTDRNSVIILEPPTQQEFKQILINFYNNLIESADANTVTCEKVNCYISTSSTWGWTGDKSNVKEKSSNKDNSEWFFQLVCIDPHTGSTSSTSNGFAKMASTQWASMHAVKNILENTASNVIEKLTLKYNQSLQSRFLSFYSELQDKLNLRTRNTFGPIESSTDTNNRYVGGYVLLRNIRSRADYSENTELDNTDFRIKLYQDNAVESENTDREAKRLKCKVSDNVFTDADDDYNFELVAGSLITTDNTELIKIAPEIGITTSTEDSLFGYKDSSASNAVPLQTFRYNLTNDLKFRLQNSVKAKDVSETFHEIQAFDAPAMPFEHDLHAENSDDFFQEFKTCIHLILQCLTATTHTQSFAEKARPFELQRVNDDTAKNFVTNDLEWQESYEDDYALFTIDVTTPLKRLQFQSLLNESNPWMHSSDTEIGACSSLLWQPSVELATGARLTPPSHESIEDLLSSLNPFGSASHENSCLTNSILQKCVAKFDGVFKQKYILKQADQNLSPPEYSPLILQYSITCKEALNQNASNQEQLDVTWSLGGTISMITEAIELTLLFLQNMLLKIDKNPENPDCSAQIANRHLKIGTECSSKNTNWTTVFPGTPDFYCDRDLAFKSVEFEDSSFSFTKINKISKSTNNDLGNNRWSGLLGIYDDREKYMKAFSNKLIVVKNEENGRNKKLRWMVRPEFEKPQFTGMGEWQGNRDPTLADVIENRYHFYKGVTPTPTASQHEIEDNPEIRKSIKYIGPKFNTSVVSTKTVFPAINASNAFESFPDFMVNSFVGWHFSNNKSLGRTVFALACGKFYRQITDFFNKPDHVHNNEEIGFNLFDTSRSVEAEFLKLLLVNIPKRAKIELTSLPVAPAIVHVRGNTTASLTTACEVQGYVVKTSTYRLIECELWGTLVNILTETRRIPPNAGNSCLGRQLLNCDRYKTRRFFIRDLLSMNSNIVVSLARLFVAIQIYDTVRRNNQTYRQKQSVVAGTNKLCIILFTYMPLILILYTGVQDIRTSAFDVLFRS